MRKLILAFALMLLPFADAYISSDIYLGNDGSATFIGRASSPLSIKGIEFDKGKIYGETQELTKKQGSIWSFSISLGDTAELKIFLPENSKLKANTLTSNLGADLADFKNSILITISGQNPQISFDYEIEGEKNSVNIFYIVLGILLVITFILLLLSLKIKRSRNKKSAAKEKRRMTRKIDIVKKTLNEREKEIVNRLIAMNSMKYSLLQRKTAIPKASFSRHIKNLEVKGIIEKTGEGRNNILKIKREMLAKA